jgi:hypothetical protein
MARPHTGWALLSVAVGAYEYRQIRAARPTLSAEFSAGLRHPVARWPVVAGWAALTGHLFGVIPARYDPVLALGATLRKLLANGH